MLWKRARSLAWAGAVLPRGFVLTVLAFSPTGSKAE
jgi:hypothetical protein